MAKQGGFSGVIAPVLTPFGEDGNPDAGRFVDHAHWLMQEGCTGLAPFGTTSEANSLGLDERMELLEELVDDGIDAATLMPGTGTCSLADTIMLTRHAMDLSCGGVLMLPPFYYKGPSEEGLFRFFAEAIEGVGDEKNLHPLQRIGHAHVAADCGFCTAGWVVTAKALLDKNLDPSADQVKAASPDTSAAARLTPLLFAR